MSIYTRNARRLIEDFTSGNDPYNLSRAGSAALAANILMEAWSPERQQSIEAKALRHGIELADHLVIGDYDLCLWYTDKVQGEGPIHLVSINNADYDPNDPEAQEAKTPATGGELPLDAIKRKVVEWVKKHGRVVVGSYVPDRNKLYLWKFKRMLPGYTFEPFWGDYKYGFYLSGPATQGDK